MSQRHSGYERQVGDFYETPAWVTEALQPHLKGIRSVWDPSAGKGSMSNVIMQWPGVKVRATDISDGTNFLKVERAEHDAIICNPPYSLGQVFIEQALRLTKPWRGRVALLLRTDFDHAKSRRHLFGGCAEFARKVVLTSRIRWFANSTGSPSFNHAWFIWDWNNIGAAQIKYHYDSKPESDEPIEGVTLEPPDYSGGTLSARMHQLRSTIEGGRL